MSESTKLDGPDLTRGIALSTLADGTMQLGHAHGEAVLLARRARGKARGLDACPGATAMVTGDASVPSPHPTMAKSSRAGGAREGWIRVGGSAFHREHEMELKCGVGVTSTGGARC